MQRDTKVGNTSKLPGQKIISNSHSGERGTRLSTVTSSTPSTTFRNSGYWVFRLLSCDPLSCKLPCFISHICWSGRVVKEWVTEVPCEPAFETIGCHFLLSCQTTIPLKIRFSQTDLRRFLLSIYPTRPRVAYVTEDVFLHLLWHGKPSSVSAYLPFGTPTLLICFVDLADLVPHLFLYSSICTRSSHI